jgi:sRNA-binding protein
MLREIRAPRVYLDRCRDCGKLRVAHSVKARIDAERAEARARQANRDTPAAHRDIERASIFRMTRRKTRRPLIDERRSRLPAVGASASQG